MILPREKLLQNITNYFIVSLAVADLLVPAIVMPFSVYVLVSQAGSYVSHTIITIVGFSQRQTRIQKDKIVGYLCVMMGTILVGGGEGSATKKMKYGRLKVPANTFHTQQEKKKQFGLDDGGKKRSGKP